MKKRDRSADSRNISRPGKGVGLAVMIIVLSMFPLFSHAGGQDSTSPKIVIPEKVFHSEPVEQGQDIEHTFTVLNKGREPLKIINVKPG